VQDGDAFARSTIDAGTFPKVGWVLSFDEPVSVGDDFFLGLNTGIGFNPLGRGVYGWVHLREEGGKLKMLGNAMAYNGSGIVIGTATIIPEPATWLLAIGAASLVPLRRRFH
jgi:hypothetical protein